MKKIKTFICSFGALLMLILSAGCHHTDPYQKRLLSWLEPDDKKLPVLCTTEMIEALVSAIGAEDVKTISLIYGELDPHSYQMVKGDSQKFSHAKIVFCNGLDLEHGPSLKTALHEHPKAVFLADYLLEKEKENFVFHGTTVDPHIWLDVGLFSKLCPLIAEELSREDPAHKNEYEKRATILKAQLQATHQMLEQEFKAVSQEKRYLVTSHEAFYYLTRAYLRAEGEEESVWKKRFCAPEGLAPESQISLHRIMEIVDHIKQHQIGSAFYEVNVTMDAIHKVQEVLSKQGYKLAIPKEPLFSDCMPPINEELGIDPTKRYFHMIWSNRDVILNQWK